MTHWFALGLDALKRKPQSWTATASRSGDPATIERVIGAPAIVVRHAAEGGRFLAYLPPERRAHAVVGPPKVAADAIRPYVEADSAEFTFNNMMYRTPDHVALVGEVLRLLD